MFDFKLYAVDFDNTMYHQTNSDWPKIGKPNYKFINFLKEEMKSGTKLILLTCREGKVLDDAIKWSEMHGVTYDAINNNIPETVEMWNGNTRKPHADVYIDDRSGWYVNSTKNGEVHTAIELYENNIQLIATIMNKYPNMSWKSTNNNDIFIAGINTKKGTITFEFSSKYKHLFSIRTISETYIPSYNNYTFTEAFNMLLDFI